jgi:hypothetical protein
MHQLEGADPKLLLRENPTRLNVEVGKLLDRPIKAVCPFGHDRPNAARRCELDNYVLLNVQEVAEVRDLDAGLRRLSTRLSS